VVKVHVRARALEEERASGCRRACDEDVATQNSRHFYCAARTARQSDLNSNVWWKGTPDLVALLKRIRADWLPPFGTIPPEPVWPWNSEERARTELLDIARGATVRGGNLTEKSSGSTEFTRPRIRPLFRNTPNGRTGGGSTPRWYHIR